jgi:hypothetical protein
MAKISSPVPAGAYPFSWTLKNWPPDVFPGDARRGRSVLRQYQSDLLKAGAVTRIGKHLVIFGAGYEKFLKSQAHRVTQFSVAPNAPEHAHKRFGRDDSTATDQA